MSAILTAPEPTRDGAGDGVTVNVRRCSAMKKVVVGQSTVDYGFTNRPETSAPRGALIRFVLLWQGSEVMLERAPGHCSVHRRYRVDH